MGTLWAKRRVGSPPQKWLYTESHSQLQFHTRMASCKVDVGTVKSTTFAKVVLGVFTFSEGEMELLAPKGGYQRSWLCFCYARGQIWKDLNCPTYRGRMLMALTIPCQICFLVKCTKGRGSLSSPLIHWDWGGKLCIRDSWSQDSLHSTSTSLKSKI